MALRRALVILALALAVGRPVDGLALPPVIEQAEAAGLVGEQADGFLGFRQAPPPDLRRLVDEVNAKRRESYAEIARRNGTDVAKVAAVAGAKLVEREPAGRWVKLPSGWVRK